MYIGVSTVMTSHVKSGQTALASLGTQLGHVSTGTEEDKTVLVLKVPKLLWISYHNLSI